ncbi:hypothetical protein OGAPHI_001191 [Ogataea philodendri]|uniref:Mediator of RNA polymerase II transcription subunit 6 n=1 Tax=Ogataea philodendri TaxID=1378263 RepID=A0A9P8PEZ4_9ASCO|nr:uncharacterized protein OGAPHI_001191 [Ogataea philodendri]KAH3670676.1 hypothetical protein OGAPHI_001191 [Ogataea philodendri]
MAGVWFWCHVAVRWHQNEVHALVVHCLERTGNNREPVVLATRVRSHHAQQWTSSARASDTPHAAERCRGSDGPSTVGAQAERRALERGDGTLAGTRASRREVRVERVSAHTGDVVTGTQVHQALWLCCPDIEDSTRVQQQFGRVRPFCGDVLDQTNVSSVGDLVLIGIVLLDGDWEPVQRTDGFAGLLVVLIELLGSLESFVNEELHGAVYELVAGGCTLGEGLEHLNSSQFSGSNLGSQLGGGGLRDGELFLGQELLGNRGDVESKLGGDKVLRELVLVQDIVGQFLVVRLDFRLESLKKSRVLGVVGVRSVKSKVHGEWTHNWWTNCGLNTPIPNPFISEKLSDTRIFVPKAVTDKAGINLLSRETWTPSSNPMREIDYSAVPGTSHLVDLDKSAHVAETKTGIVLIPEPSNDPNDPLNWSKGRKLMHAFCLVVFVFGGGIPSCCIYSILTEISDYSGISLSDLNNGTGYFFLFLGLGNLLLMPLAQQYGKRPVYLVSTLGSLGFNLWLTYVKGNGQWIAAKILCGILQAPGESLPEISVGDVWFEHERATYMGVYSVALFGSNYLAPMVAGFINDSLGWKWVLWLACIFNAVCFVFLFFFLEESNYFKPRHPSGAVSEDYASGEKTHANVEVVTMEDVPLRTFWQRLSLTYGVNPKNNLKDHFMGAFYMAQFPAVLYAGFLYGASLFWYSVLNATEALVLGGEPYNFSPAMCGLAYVSPVIFALIIYPYAGWSTDYIKIWFARKNKGMSQAEDRFWVLVPYMILGPVSLILWGVGAAKGIHWFGVVFGLGLMAGLCTIGCVSSVTYIVDCYEEMTYSAITVVIVIRNVMNFAMDYGITPFVTNVGLQNCFVASAFICLFCYFFFFTSLPLENPCLFFFPMSLDNLDELQWRSPEWVNAFGLRTDNVLEYFSQSPFFDRTSNNQVLKMQNQFTDTNFYNKPYDLLLQDLRKMRGIEFVIAMVREPDFWIIRKQNRTSETETDTLADYYIIGSSVYMAPVTHAVLSSRFLASVLSLRNAIGELQHLPSFSPSNGHQYLLQTGDALAAPTADTDTARIPDSSANAFSNLLNLSLQNNAVVLETMPVTGINESALVAEKTEGVPYSTGFGKSMFSLSGILKPKTPAVPQLEPLEPVNGKYDHLLPIVWVDCEMTGLDLQNDHIIEVCCLITDKHLRLIDETGYEAVVHYPKERMDQMDEWCTSHHGDSGLTQKVIESSNTVDQVQQQLTDYLGRYMSKGVGILAGNSVHVDRQYLCKEMPKVTNYLTYRIIDVSSIMEMARRHNPTVNEYTPDKIGAHTARSDILESINQLKYYRDVYLKGPEEVEFGTRKRRRR